MLRSIERGLQNVQSPDVLNRPPDGDADFDKKNNSENKEVNRDESEIIERTAELRRSFESGPEQSLADDLRIYLGSEVKIDPAVLDHLSHEFQEEIALKFSTSAEKRAELLKKVTIRAQELLKTAELDTAGKVAAAILENLPVLSILPAITGKRISEVTRRGIKQVDIDLLERGLYVAGALSPVPGTQFLLTLLARHERSQPYLNAMQARAEETAARFYQTAISQPLISLLQTSL